ncbi:hypothetical protein B0J18DRAFT_364984 [Chaetomium sp. MPI-SDFR-AT-0129]|nr:hypothetical protein B0J18DRAFT_364984 [Chaetomium sp. MPI-SDFR-AT-0129]
MDDPWGSPWAATDSDKGRRAASPAKSDIAPPPRAFLSASNSPRIPDGLEQHSPWGGGIGGGGGTGGDDAGGFGEWATPAAVVDTPGHSVWAGGWGGSSPNLLATPRDDAALGRNSPITLPGSVASSKPAGGSSGFRQPSPDPWGSGFSSRRPSHNDAGSTPRLVVETASPVDEPIEIVDGGVFGIDGGLTWDKADTGGDNNVIPTITDVPDITTSPVMVSVENEEEERRDERSTPVPAPSDDVRLSVESVVHGHEDQSSAPSNDNTDYEEDRQDSPITSIDEEPRGLRPVSRKESNKVYELVVKFDGLARAASEEREVIPRARSTSRSSAQKREDWTDNGDFGEFEDTHEDGQGGNHEPSVRLEEPLEEPEPKRDPRPEEAPQRDADTTSPTHSEPDTPPPRLSPIATYGPIYFGVDLALVGKLLSEPSTSNKLPEVERSVPDHVISDSFTTISERKSWYRISRLGSSRRHNAGDDDNYRRVAWPSSTVHDDTIKIVRRWMEEDSIAGRVALGGGISKTQKNMFGWDSSAEPVALETIFRKKFSHNRASSAQPLKTTGLFPGPTDGLAKASPLRSAHRATESVGPGVPSFGWGSTSDPPPRATHQRTISGQSSTSSAAIPAPATTNDDNDNDEDDDDEWGEMVSSPVVSQPPVLPATKQAPPTTLKTTQTVIPRQPSEPVVEESQNMVAVSIFDSIPANPMPPSETPATPASISKVVETANTNSTAGPNPALGVGDTPIAKTAVDSISSTLTGDARSSAIVDEPQDDQEETVHRILAGLPDFSYMSL